MKKRDPVHQHKGAWWFWNDTWTRRMGPYETKEELALALEDYCVNKLGMTRQELGIKTNLLQETTNDEVHQ